MINWNHEGIGSHVLITWGGKASSVFPQKFNYIFYATFSLLNLLCEVNTGQDLCFSFSSNCVSAISLHLRILSDGPKKQSKKKKKQAVMPVILVLGDPLTYWMYMTMWLLVSLRHSEKSHFNRIYNDYWL